MASASTRPIAATTARTAVRRPGSSHPCGGGCGARSNFCQYSTSGPDRRPSVTPVTAAKVVSRNSTMLPITSSGLNRDTGTTANPIARATSPTEASTAPIHSSSPLAEASRSGGGPRPGRKGSSGSAPDTGGFSATRGPKVIGS